MQKLFYIMNERMILRRNKVKRLSSLRNFRALLSVRLQKVSLVFLHCSQSESSSRSSVLYLYPEYLRLLRMTSPLLIDLADREGSHWILTIPSFIGDYGPTLSMGVRKCKGHLQTTGSLIKNYTHSRKKLH